MASFSIGLTALTTSQRSLDIIGQNIANASTPGYHRQVARLASRLPTEVGGLSIGSGVEITDVRRLRSIVLESAVTRHAFESADTTAQLDTLRQVESLLSPGEGSVHDLLEAFFNQLEQLSSRPDDMALRRVALGGAAALTDEFNSLAGQLGLMRENLDAQIRGIVDQINPLARQIAELNEAIERAEVRGISDNDQRDQRDQLINEMADLVGVQTIEQPQGQTTVLVAGFPMVVGNQHNDLEVSVDQAGNAVVRAAGSTQSLPISGGKLGGVFRVRNQFLPDYRKRLDTLARELAGALDGLHTTGMALAGPFTFLAGRRGVSDVSIPLEQAELSFPPQAGSLFVSMTNLATGQRTLNEIAIDPATQSLQDVAAAISGVNHMQALVDTQTGTLTILAQAGYAFDFAGRLESTPDTSGITGTTLPQIAGLYRGASNDVFTFEVQGSGTVGVTPNLQLQVKNSAGAMIASLNIGQGYEPGSLLQVADGVAVQLASGSANNGDTFSTRVVSQPDTAGILRALGLNTFFAGDDASNIHVSPDLLAHPELLAASRTGQPGDGANLRSMTALRDAQLLAGGTQTFRQSYAAMVGDVGVQVQELSLEQTHQELLGQRLEAERQSVSGVDPNEELVKMVEFQRMFQMAAKYVSTVNETLQDLVNII